MKHEDKRNQRYERAQEMILELYDMLPDSEISRTSEIHQKLMFITGALGEFTGLSEGYHKACESLKEIIKGGAE